MMNSEQSSDLERIHEREIRKGEAAQECANDDAALDRQEIIATTVIGKADVVMDQPTCDQCERPLGIHRVGVRVAGWDFYLDAKLCRECQDRIAASIKRKLKSV